MTRSARAFVPVRCTTLALPARGPDDATAARLGLHVKGDGDDAEDGEIDDTGEMGGVVQL